MILATHNAGKLTELREQILQLGWELAGMADYGLGSPVEDGGSFDANALIKALHAGEGSGLWALADDSGLEVDALDGLPGVETSTYGGYEVLLDALRDVEEARRTARFRCVLVLWRKGVEPLYFRGCCEGHISLEARGDGGFGYDPVFIPAGEARTFAQMSKTEKSEYSHRGQAVRAFLEWLEGQTVLTESR